MMKVSNLSVSRPYRDAAKIGLSLAKRVRLRKIPNCSLIRTYNNLLARYVLFFIFDYVGLLLNSNSSGLCDFFIKYFYLSRYRPTNGFNDLTFFFLLLTSILKLVFLHLLSVLCAILWSG